MELWEVRAYAASLSDSNSAEMRGTGDMITVLASLLEGIIEAHNTLVEKVDRLDRETFRLKNRLDALGGNQP